VLSHTDAESFYEKPLPSDFSEVPHRKMPMAFVLINAEIGSEDAVVKELKAVSNVKEAYMVYGVYDIVAKVAADSMDKLKEIITWKVRRLNKVKSTLTMIVIEQ
jgi:DNA-binding Lrp family transcriptional regulator